MADAELAFTLKAKGGPQAAAEVERDAARMEAATKRVNESATLSVAQQARAVESLQRQRSSAILSIVKAMEGDVGRSAAATERQHSLTDRLIADSQRAIANAERSAAGAAASVEKVGARLAVASTEAAGMAGQWEALAGVLTGPVVIGVGAAVAAIAGLGALLAKFVSDTAEAGDQLYDLSQKTNFSVESLSALKNAAETSGGSLETVTASLNIFNKNLGQADEAGSKVAKTLDALNVVQGDQEQTLRRVFKALYDLRGSYLQNEYAQALFGKGSKDLLGIINQSEGSLDQMIERYRELGTLITTHAAKGAQDYKDKLAEVRQQIEGVERELGNRLLPTALRVLGGISQALKDNKREWTEWSSIIVDVGEGVSALLYPFVQMEGILIRVARATTPILDVLKALKELREYFNGPHVEGVIDASGAARGGSLYQGQGVNVPEGLRYDSSKADAAYNASQFAGAGAFVKQQEEAQKRAEAEAKRVRTEVENETKRQADVIKQISQAYAEASVRVSGYTRDSLQLEAALYKLSIGYSTLSEANKKLAQDEINKLFSAKRELQHLEAATALQKALNQAIDDAQAVARGEKTHVDEVNEALGRFIDAGGQADETLRKLTARALFFANQRDFIESLDHIADTMERIGKVPLGGEGPGGIPIPMPTGFDGKPKGPFVDPKEFTAEFGEPPAPKFDLWKESLNGLKDVGKGVFGGLTQGFGGMVQAFLMGEKGAAKSFGAIAKAAIASMAAQAAVSALFQLAEGFAWLFINPPKAAAHFQSAAVFGIVAGMAGAASALIPGGGSDTGSAFSSSGSAFGGGGSTAQDSGPRVVEQSRNTVVEHIHTIRLEPGLVVEHVTQDVRGNGKLRGLIIETAGA